MKCSPMLTVGLPLTTIFILINQTTNLSINQLIYTINFPQKSNILIKNILLNQILISMKSFFKSKLTCNIEWKKQVSIS